jgi:hypothetical protein
MKNNALSSVLTGALVIGALGVFGLALGIELHFRKMRSLNTQMIAIQQANAVGTALMNDTLEYSKRNPAVDPILAKYGFKQAAPAATK